MSKTKAPKEIFFSKYMTAFIGKERAVKTEIRCAGNEGDIKYLSEEHVKEMLAEKQDLLDMYDLAYGLLEYNTRVKLEEKDREIERLNAIKGEALEAVIKTLKVAANRTPKV